MLQFSICMKIHNEPYIHLIVYSDRAYIEVCALGHIEWHRHVCGI